jgi:hypothetical protein
MAVACSGALLLVVSPYRSDAQPSKQEQGMPFETLIKLQQEAAQLRSLLSDSDKTVREKAFDRLNAIGPVAFGALHPSLVGNDREARRLSFELMGHFQRIVGVQPCIVDELEFLPTFDLNWKIPAPGETTKIDFRIRLKNVSKDPIVFNRANAIRFYLYDASGFNVSTQAGVEWDYGLPRYTPVLAAGDTCTVSDLSVKLRRSPDGSSTTLSADDDAGWYSAFRGLSPGRFFLAIQCESPRFVRAAPPLGSRQWDANFTMRMIAIDIR